MPKLIPALIAEFFGVLFYSLAGEMATAGFLITTYAGTPMGNLTMIGFAYAFGITFAIVVCATTSGGQFHPGFTIAQVVFKGFPIKLAPLYIAAQILGGMAASLIVMGSWHDELMKITHLLEATGKAATIFTAEGPAGAIALFPTPGRSMGSIFVNEFFADVLVAMLVWANLDASNPFTGPQVAPYTIGLGFAMVVWCFSSSNVAANTARDLGARFVCGMFWGDQCFPAGYSALAALTNIPATLVGCGIYTFFLSDTRRPLRRWRSTTCTRSTCVPSSVPRPCTPRCSTRRSPRPSAAVATPARSRRSAPTSASRTSDHSVLCNLKRIQTLFRFALSLHSSVLFSSRFVCNVTGSQCVVPIVRW